MPSLVLSFHGCKMGFLFPFTQRTLWGLIGWPHSVTLMVQRSTSLNRHFACLAAHGWTSSSARSLRGLQERVAPREAGRS